jgi:hypothetical protein
MQQRLMAKCGRNGAMRTALAVFALACMNLAMLPCSMAEHAGIRVASATAGIDTPAHHGGHQDAMAEHCDSEAQDCCQLDGAQASERSQGSGKDIGGDVVVPHPMTRAAAANEIRTAATARSRPPDLVRGQPRRHLIDCVFLD